MKGVILYGWRTVVFVLLLMIGLPGSGGAQTQINFGLIPLQSAAIMNQRFTPLMDYLSKEVGIPFRLRIGKDYQATMDDIGKNVVQVAYLTPTTYPKAERQYPEAGIRPLVKFLERGQAFYKSCIIVRSGSPIASIADIKGKRFAFGSEDSTASHLMPRNMLISAGVDVEKDLKEIKYTGTHTNVANAVASGMMDAGGLIEGVAEDFEKQGRVKILARSGDIPQFPICVNNSLSPAIIDRIEAALLKLDPSNADHQKVLAAIDGRLTGATKAASADYDIIRDMIMRLYGESFYKR